MEKLGSLSVLLASCIALFAVIAALAGKYGRRPFTALSAELSGHAVWCLLTLALGLLGLLAHGLLDGNNESAGIFARNAFLGRRGGSVLFWAWLLASYSSAIVYVNRGRFRQIMPIVIAIMMTTLAFLGSLITFVVNPFLAGPIDPNNEALNPLLQQWAVGIHSATLCLAYLGYVGYVVPFAFAIASLLTGQLAKAPWIQTTRRWVIVTWLLQNAGILVGVGWAFTQLGWGGYWSLDPIPLLGWVSATALLCVVMRRKKKHGANAWDAVLISATFLLCFLAAGRASADDTYAPSPFTPYFTIYALTALALATFAILKNLTLLRHDSNRETPE